MKSEKEKIRMRRYDIPQEDFLLALQGRDWQRSYGTKNNILHFHNLMEIGVCLWGNGNLWLEERGVPYAGGMISVIPPNYPHNVESREGMECCWEFLFVDPEKILALIYPDDILQQQRMQEMVNKRAFLCREDEIPDIAGVVHSILNETREKKELYRVCARGLVMTLMVMIARTNAGQVSLGGFIQKNEFAQIRPALNYIRDHYETAMKISNIADVCHISESHFRRLFEKNVGMTPVEYLNQVRVQKACDLLRKTRYSMEEIAVKVGFSTTSTFNRNFKRIVGISPYRWKKQPDNYENRLKEFRILTEKGW